VNNSIYTNIVASLAIHYANYTTCLIDLPPLDPVALTKARCLHLPFDENRKIHLEYEGYTDSEIKQADVVLLGFPLMWSMNPEIKRNDLFFYENKTRSSGPAMTWGFLIFFRIFLLKKFYLLNSIYIQRIHSIGLIDLGEFEKAAQFLSDSYEQYVQKPFNV